MIQIYFNADKWSYRVMPKRPVWVKKYTKRRVLKGMRKRDMARALAREEGVMDCPPFVVTVGDVHSYFGDIPHEIVGLVPRILGSTRQPRWANYGRRRTLTEDGFIEYLSEQQQEALERGRLEVSVRERKEHKEKTALIGRRSVIPLYHRYDDEGNRVAGYNTLRAAAEAVGVHYRAINYALQSPSRHSGGYRWRKSEFPPEKIEPFKKR